MRTVAFWVTTKSFSKAEWAPSVVVVARNDLHCIMVEAAASELSSSLCCRLERQ